MSRITASETSFDNRLVATLDRAFELQICMVRAKSVTLIGEGDVTVMDATARMSDGNAIDNNA